jgi:hypothetical protein
VGCATQQLNIAAIIKQSKKTQLTWRIPSPISSKVKRSEPLEMPALSFTQQKWQRQYEVTG